MLGSRARWSILVGAVSSAAVVSPVACLDATEITVKLSTNAPCKAGPTAAVFLNGVDAPLAQSTSCVDGATNSFGSLVVLPKASSNERVEIRVVAATDSTTSPEACAAAFTQAASGAKLTLPCIEAKRSVGFIAHKPLELPIVLDVACAGVACGTGSTCSEGRCVDDTVACASGTCGAPDAGAAPDANAPDASPPADAGPPTTPLAISAFGDGTCVVTAKHNVQCWGTLPPGVGTSPIATPTAIPALAGARIFTLGKTHACGIAASDGAVTCVGTNANGELDGSPKSGSQPVSVPAPVGAGLTTTVYSLAVGDSHTCAYGTLAGSLGSAMICWGDNASGKLGSGSASVTHGPVPLVGAPVGTYLGLTAGSNHTCALFNGGSPGEIVCWGSNVYGQSGSTSNFVGPIVITGANSGAPAASMVAARLDHGEAACGSAGALWWGNDVKGGASGTGLTRSSAYADSVPGLATAKWSQVAAGDAHTCATDGTNLACWGSAANPAIGSSYATGVVLVNLQGITALAAGATHTCAIADGPGPVTPNASKRVWCWGSNTNGQLGTGDKTAHGTPVEVTLAPE